jgi:hypothetical protein
MTNPSTLIDDTQEVWRSVPGTDHYYHVSSFGQVRDNRTNIVTYGTRGIYLTVWIREFHKSMGVHRLVALAFLGERPGDAVVNHIDLNKHNNRLSNLEYVSSSRNRQHAVDHYSHTTPEAIQARLKGVILLRAKGWTYKDISVHYGLGIDVVRKMCQDSNYLKWMEYDYDYLTPRRLPTRSAFDGDD